MDLDKWISKASAARMLGVTRQAVQYLVKKGKLRACKITKTVEMVDRISVDERKREEDRQK